MKIKIQSMSIFVSLSPHNCFCVLKYSAVSSYYQLLVSLCIVYCAISHVGLKMHKSDISEEKRNIDIKVVHCIYIIFVLLIVSVFFFVHFLLILNSMWYLFFEYL